ncbi:MAG: helix-turn-helix transcriptional regulator [Gemmatimonadota bacterium]
MTAITKTQRWLDVIAYLVGRRLPVPVDEILAHVPAYAERLRDGGSKARDSVRRMFERDKDELRKAGVPIETVTFRIHYGQEEAQGYRLARREFFLPYLKLATGEEPGGAPAATSREGALALDEEETVAALSALDRMAGVPGFPLAREARSAFRKLAFDLEPERPSPSPFLYAGGRSGDEVKARVEVLSEAVLARKRVRFAYHGIFRGEATDREIEPYGLMFRRGSWYLAGYDVGREGIRLFHVGRMGMPRMNDRAPGTPDYEIPDTFSLQRYRDREAWEAAADGDESIEVRVLFRFPLSLWAERNGFGRRVARREDGAEVRTFRVADADAFQRWVLGLGGEARVVEPVELRDELVAMARETLAAYEAGAGGGSPDG